MNYIKFYIVVFFLPMLFMANSIAADDTKDKRNEQTLELVKTNVNGEGNLLLITLKQGEAHNHPTMAFWIEDTEGNYLQTLYVTKSLATGVFKHGEKETEKWKNEPGEARRPAALPYYIHKRNVLAPDSTYLPTPKNPIPDAYTGATPKADFSLETKTDAPLTGKFVLLFEVNQPWDWNKYWNNALYPDNFNYTTSCQPALVYAVTIDLNNKMESYYLNPIGHSHYAGDDGKLYTNLSTFTTALKIFDSIQVFLK